MPSYPSFRIAYPIFKSNQLAKSEGLPDYIHVIHPLAASILARRLENGSFSATDEKIPCPDATAWAVIALRQQAEAAEAVKSGRDWLKSIQLEDGRIGASPGQPQAWWPTPLSVLAWQGAADCEPARQRALNFLLASGGVVFKDPNKKVSELDTELRGWSWINGTISWIEPTAQTILALEVAGMGAHERVAEAAKMIMNRQLPSGGWNYGNSKVYGAELRPMPANTGLALDALAGKVTAEEVAHSLTYMAETVEKIRAPLSTAWGVMGLRAWARPPGDAAQLLARSADFQKMSGTFETGLLGQLLVATLAPGGFRSHFAA